MHGLSVRPALCSFCLFKIGSLFKYIQGPGFVRGDGFDAAVVKNVVLCQR